MRKLHLMAIMAFFVAKSKSEAQEKPPSYLTIITTGINTGKDFTGGSEKNVYAKIQGVYGKAKKLGLAYHGFVVLPLDPQRGRPMEKYTIVSLGVGKVSHLRNKSTMALGAGPTVGIVPNHGSNPKTSSVYYGGTAHCNYVNGFHVGGDITFVILPPKTSNDWNKNMFLGEVEILYFFNKLIGVKAIYAIERVNDVERQVQGVSFQQSNYSERRSNLIGGICFRLGSAIIFAGPNIRTQGQKYSFYDAFGSFQSGKNAHNQPIGMNLSLNFNLEAEK